VTSAGAEREFERVVFLELSSSGLIVFAEGAAGCQSSESGLKRFVSFRESSQDKRLTQSGVLIISDINRPGVPVPKFPRKELLTTKGEFMK